MSLFLTFFGKNPILTDDSPQGLVSSFPNVIIHERLHTIKPYTDISNCSECFSNKSFINNVQEKGFSFNNHQPYLSYNTENSKIPLMLSRKMSGLPFYFYGVLSSVFGPLNASLIYHIFVGVLILGISFFAIYFKYGSNIAFTSSLLLSISPIFLTNNFGYVSEPLLSIFFFLSLLIINIKKEKLFIIIPFIFLLGIHIKLNFLAGIIALVLLEWDFFKKYKRIVFISLFLIFLYFIFLLSLPGNAQNEILTRDGQSYIKPFNHIINYLIDIFMMIVSPFVYLFDFHGLLKIKHSYSDYNVNSELFNYLSLACLFAIFPILSIWQINSRKVLTSFFILASFAFIFSHQDSSYSLRIFESYPVLVLAVAIGLNHFYDNRRYIPILGALIFYSFSFFYWSSKTTVSYNDPLKSLSFMDNIQKYLVENNIKNPILNFDENEWGYLEYLSQNRIQPFHLKSLTSYSSVKEIFSYFKEGHLLINLSPQYYFDSEKNKEFSFNYSKKEILKYALAQNIKVNDLKTFSYNNRDVYWLIKFSNSKELLPISDNEKSRILKIAEPVFFR